MNKLGQSEEKTSEAEAKREDIPKSDEKPSEVKSLPKFGFIPTAKPKTDEKNDTTKEETDKTKTTVGPKFGFVASVPKDEKSEEKGKEETKTESTTTTKPKFGFFNPQAGSTDNKPKPLNSIFFSTFFSLGSSTSSSFNAVNRTELGWFSFTIIFIFWKIEEFINILLE